jgi:hypothetical protein
VLVSSTAVYGQQHGGRVDTPLQLVGEAGPELVSLPIGSRVHSAPETEEIMRRTAEAPTATGTSEAMASEQLARITAAVQENTRRLEEATRKGLTLDPYEVAGQIDTIKAEKEAFSAT